MKISIEIDLPFIDEDGALHDDTKNEIIHRIVQRCETKILADIKPRVDAVMDSSINSVIDNILDDYLSKPVTISNGFKKAEYESVYDMVEKKMGALYDAEIKRTSSSCGTDPVLLKLDSKIKQSMQTLLAGIDQQIQKEANLIAQKALKESSVFGALQKAGLIK